MTITTSRITFLLALALAVAGNLKAEKVCGNESLKGTFGEIGWGAIPAPVIPTLGGPFVRVGQTVADGNGNVVSHTAASFNGIIYQVDSYAGTYTVNPDCTAIFHMQIPIPDAPPGFLLPTDLTGVLSDDGREVSNLVISPTGLSIRILFHKQNDRMEDQNQCSNQDLNGDFGLDMFGTVVSQPGNPPGTLSRVGKVTFDGNGSFHANWNVNYNGSPVTEDMYGTYAIDAGCRIKMSYSLAGTSYTWFGGLSYQSGQSDGTTNSDGATVMVTDPPGAAVVGTLRRQ